MHGKTLRIRQPPRQNILLPYLLRQQLPHHGARQAIRCYSLRSMTRREILKHGPMALASTTGALRRAPAQTGDPKYAEVKTAYGRVRGAQGDGLATFKGIPYAGPVSGANRFKAAPPLKPWTGLRDALMLGAPAIQPGQRRNVPPQDEDCLFLNIWTPAEIRWALRFLAIRRDLARA